MKTELMYSDGVIYVKLIYDPEFCSPFFLAMRAKGVMVWDWTVPNPFDAKELAGLFFMRLPEEVIRDFEKQGLAIDCMKKMILNSAYYYILEALYSESQWYENDEMFYEDFMNSFSDEIRPIIKYELFVRGPSKEEVLERLAGETDFLDEWMKNLEKISSFDEFFKWREDMDTAFKECVIADLCMQKYYYQLIMEELIDELEKMLPKDVMNKIKSADWEGRIEIISNELINIKKEAINE